MRIRLPDNLRFFSTKAAYRDFIREKTFFSYTQQLFARQCSHHLIRRQRHRVQSKCFHQWVSIRWENMSTNLSKWSPDMRRKTCRFVINWPNGNNRSRMSPVHMIIIILWIMFVRCFFRDDFPWFIVTIIHPFNTKTIIKQFVTISKWSKENCWR